VGRHGGCRRWDRSQTLMGTTSQVVILGGYHGPCREFSWAPHLMSWDFMGSPSHVASFRGRHAPGRALSWVPHPRWWGLMGTTSQVLGFARSRQDSIARELRPPPYTKGRVLLAPVLRVEPSSGHVGPPVA
jgi:hypothetical protein